MTMVQTDAVRSIPCGTSGGVVLNFEQVEVVNRLKTHMVVDTVRNYTINYDKTWIFDKIHHEINQFCSSHTLQEVYITEFDTLDESLAAALQRDVNHWAPGIEIIAVRVTKPRIPDSIRANYESMEAEKTKLLISREIQHVVELEAQTEKMRSVINAQREADVSEIAMQREIAEKEARKLIAQLEDSVHLAHEKAVADAAFYAAAKEAEGNKERLTPEYLRYTEILAMANNSKIFFGQDIPSVFVDAPSPPAVGGK